MPPITFLEVARALDHVLEAYDRECSPPVVEEEDGPYHAARAVDRVQVAAARKLLAFILPTQARQGRAPAT